MSGIEGQLAVVPTMQLRQVIRAIVSKMKDEGEVGRRRRCSSSAFGWRKRMATSWMRSSGRAREVPGSVEGLA